ncbi:MAG TPA: phosphoribosylamine--glycine ligase [Syntrophomonadaceae bacterium]|nr:phosphoribosylamine--glycine ligase [Syntrophomonadaceae bacterium]HRX20596.1 phosphoribosylamine--glycine ligase [Syntrophomonadaceae bacterium]
MGKRILVIGQGGREHALIWKLNQSPGIDKLYAAPGNPGIAALAECIDIQAEQSEQLLKWAQQNAIDLTIVGPEIPLMEGIVDKFTDAGLKIFGPSAAAARLEGSKIFAKNLFKKYGIPTAQFEVFDNFDAARAFAYELVKEGKPVVIKADGLAAGKGVVIASTWQEADQALNSMMKDRSFGAAGDRVIIEEFLRGEEVSFFVLSDGKNFIPLIAAQDHKQIFDDDMGPNTGGMGAYVNPPVFTRELETQAIEKVIRPVIAAMEAEGCTYKGVLYAGLMITDEGPKVLEFNARFGDPETQVVMPMIKGDLLPLLEASVNGELENHRAEMESGNCVCVVLASQGYPGPYEKGQLIEGLENLAADTIAFHAGTRLEDGKLYTNGGRVLAVACRGADIKEARNKAYDEVKKINFAGMHYRTDIARKALRRG